MIDPRFVVNLKGKDYPLFQGVLDAATNAGLRSLCTTIVQIPAAENGHMAVVLVRAEFEDGRAFESVGDASPANCSASIASAALRMAETRAGGRAMRAAINCGMTLLEELPDEERQAGNGHERVQATPASPRRADTTGSASATRVDPAGVCSWPECETLLNKNQVTLSKHHADRPLCPVHLADFRREKEAATR